MAIAQLAWYGMGFEYLWPDSPNWGNVAALVGFNATGFFGALFTRSFLNLPKNAKKLNKVIIFSAICFASLIFLIPIASYQAIGIMTSIVGAFYSIFAIISAIVCMLGGFSSARFFLLANTILLIGAAALGVRNLGWVPTNFFTTYAMLIGSALEMLLLSFALAERINEMKQAKEIAEQRVDIMRDSMHKIIQHQDHQIEAKVTKRTQLLHDLAHTDKLTGLGNRLSLEESLPNILMRSKQQATYVGLLFIDLDNFKPINDHYGHGMGDQLLKLIASRMKTSVREDDIIIRLGGDEFVIIIEDIVQEEVLRKVCQSVLRAIANPVSIDNVSLETGASIGVALAPFDGETMAKLINAADKAMYQAKLAGKNKVYYAPELKKKLT